MKSGKPLDPENAKVAVTLHESMTDFDEPITVYRGLDVSPEEASSLMSSFQAAEDSGDEIQLKGFTSTSLAAKEAAVFTGDPKVAFEIVAKRGLFTNGASKSPNELEVILDHGAKFEVVRVGRGHKVKWFSSDTTIIRLEML